MQTPGNIKEGMKIKMFKVRDFYEYINRIAPFSTALSFDNAGFLAGAPEKEVKTVLLSLDIPSYVADEASEKHIDLVISHHPVIFEPLKKVTPAESVYHLIANNIAAICAHTNLDVAQGGVNDVLCEKVGLSDISGFSPEGEENVGRIGFLSEDLPVSDFAAFLKQTLNASCVQFTDSGKPVRKIAVVSGAGGGYSADALRCDCDTLLTGEAKYNYFIEAKERGINLLAAGHYATENPVLFALKTRLEKEFPGVDFIISETNTQLPESV